MKEMDKIFENAMINVWVERFLRSKKQFNKPHETDAELLEIPELKDSYLAVTIDTVAEEIMTGLYQETYTMGWIAVMASISDLAAVGADPLGIVISVSVPPEADQSFAASIAGSVEEACRALDIHVLGGDTNSSPLTSITCCALGLVSKDKVITRVGCKPDERIYMTGGAGIGNALGLARLTKLPKDLFPETYYRPRARIKEGKIIRQHASCCMDTSDGLLTTLDQLMRLNGLGFFVNCDWEKILIPQVYDLCKKTGTPPWFMLAGPHGEFELVFTCDPESIEKIKSACKNVEILNIGKVQKAPTLSLALPSGSSINIDMAPVRNLLQTVGGNLEQYAREFIALGRKMGIE